jgi:hypothetical protein
VPVEYFNPFRNLQIDPAVSLEELEKSAHCFGEVVGLGLRNLAHCPVELNLMPKSSIQKQEFGRKRPYFIATVFSLVLVVFAYGFFYQKLAAVKGGELARLRDKTAPLRDFEGSLGEAMGALNQTRAKLNQVGEWVEDRYFWPQFLGELRQAFERTETATRRPGVDSGVWIESIIVATGPLPKKPATSDDPDAADPDTEDPEMADPAMGPDTEMAETEGAQQPSRFAAAAAAAQTSTNDITQLKLVCRAINLNKVSPSANTDIAFALAQQLKALPSLGPETQLTGEMQPVPDTDLTFTFNVTLALKRPITL